MSVADNNNSEAILTVENITLSFGAVRAIRDVSFDIQKSEIRAIIGPNGAGKTSMLNVINGFYHPQQGRISFRGEVRKQMRPYEAAAGGIARTFQNVALFKGMSTLDNIITGRNLKMNKWKVGLIPSMFYYGPTQKEEIQHRQYVEEIISSKQDTGPITGWTTSETSSDEEQDELYDEAVNFVIDSRRASISAVQRKLRIGYNRAARLIETMEEAGLVSEMSSNGSREVLVPKRD